MKKITLISFLIILVDQISKLLVRTMMDLNSEIEIIPNFLSITYVENKGAAFNILEGRSLFLVLIAIIIIILLIRHIKKNSIKKFDSIVYSIILGGIIGNLIDRILKKSVTDFIAFQILSYNAPIFNLADSFICIGCILLIWGDYYARN